MEQHASYSSISEYLNAIHQAIELKDSAELSTLAAFSWDGAEDFLQNFADEVMKREILKGVDFFDDFREIK
jgi:hypothetical protein